jgi:hypothetical protein
MKMLRTENELISLENVRKVTHRMNTSKHTSKGVAYTIDHHSIHIQYLEEKMWENIECGEDATGKEKAQRLFEEIFKILSEKA